MDATQLYRATITRTDGSKHETVAHLASIDAYIKMLVGAGTFAAADIAEFTLSQA